MEESDTYLPLGNLVTSLPISSQIHKSTILDVLVHKDSSNRLMSDSLVKTRQISSFDRRRFIKRIGFCQSVIMQQILQNVAFYLNI